MFLILDSIYINIQCFNFLCTYAKIVFSFAVYVYKFSVFMLDTYIFSVFISGSHFQYTCTVHTCSVCIHYSYVYIFSAFISHAHNQCLHSVFSFLVLGYIPSVFVSKMHIYSQFPIRLYTK